MKKQKRTQNKFLKPALVLSGGATKAAAFHSGVCLALKEVGFTFSGGAKSLSPPQDLHPFKIDTYVGSSAGAWIAALLASGIPIESLISTLGNTELVNPQEDSNHLPRLNYRDMLNLKLPNIKTMLKSFKKQPLSSKSMESLILNSFRVPGFFSTDKLARYLKNHILPTDDFKNLNASLFVTATELDSSEHVIFSSLSENKSRTHYHNHVSISDAVGCSMSLPPLFVPYKLDDPSGLKKYYTDGEIRETLSAHVAVEQGADLIICSYTHQPYQYQNQIGSLYQYGIPAIMIQSIYQTIEKRTELSKKSVSEKRITLEIIDKFFKKENLSESLSQKLKQALCKMWEFNEQVNYINIHPEPKDHEMFFGDHFTLSESVLKKMAEIGYKRGIKALKTSPALGCAASC